MKLNNNHTKPKFDWITVLLLFFALTLIALLVYLQKVDKSIKDYEVYQNSINKLYQYNQDFDMMFLQSYRYLDNDKITSRSRLFEDRVIYLEESRLTQKFGKDVIKTIDKIKLDYIKKSYLIESFKTYNARVITTIYYLYEIKKEIYNNTKISADTKAIVWEVLFNVGQVIFDASLRLDDISKNIAKLKDNSKDRDISLFYRHTKQLVLDVKKLNEIIIKNRELDLAGSIDSINIILDEVYQSYHQEENLIGISFFIFAFIILLILVTMYIKVKKNREEVYRLAYSDRLTKLPNRIAFEEYLDNIIDKSNQNNFFILFLDIDRFKVVNDTLGHDVGDEILVILGKRLLSILQEGDFLAHSGGDEFVVIVEANRLSQSIEVLASTIYSTIKKQINIKGYKLSITSSIGIVNYPTDGKDKRTIIKYADMAMYSAKESGGDSYAFYNQQLSINMQRRLDLEQELSNALDKKEFTLNFQPQYSLNTGKITGAEALIRWNSPILGSVSPEEFIQVAEETGLIVELGYYIFYEACKSYMGWIDDGIELDLIAINISSVQLEQVDAFERLKVIIEDVGIDARHIEIELTERSIMESSGDKDSILDKLRALGCRISIDDFGTGYSSMSYLKTLPIDTIKIDKSFILDIPDNQHDIDVAKAIIILSQSLGYEVIAEGIENIEQENILKNFSCDKGQGYFFAKPMDNESFIEFIKNHN